MRRGLIIICELAEIRLTFPRKKASIKKYKCEICRFAPEMDAARGVLCMDRNV